MRETHIGLLGPRMTLLCGASILDAQNVVRIFYVKPHNWDMVTCTACILVRFAEDAEEHGA